MTAPSLRLEGFEVVRHIGAGGLGDVFVAVRKSTGGEVAVKLLRDFGSVDDVERRIGRELEALLMLKGHPGVVQIEEILPTANGPAMVMEYASGGSLRSVVDAGGALSTAQVLRIGVEVGGLLADAHALGIVHRDIKPHNVLLTAFGTYKVCDFGISALSKSDDWAEQTSAISYRYASPEEIDGDGATAASDVFSLGVTMVQAWSGTNKGVRSTATAELPRVDLRDRQLEELLGSMLESHPDARPTAAEVRDRCRALEGGSVLPADDDDADTTVVRPTPRPDDDDASVIRGRPGPTADALPPPASPSTGTGLPAPSTDREWWKT